jgi:phosphoglycolate phosphatase-like HAD superfamily hydrolase
MKPAIGDLRTQDVRIIFIDDGGVLNDNERRGAEWRRLIGEFLSPRLGGKPLAWGAANRVVFANQWKRFESWNELHSLDEDYVDFFSSGGESLRWLREMCEHVGVPAPDDAAEVAAATERYVQERIRSGFADAAPGVRLLFDAGYTLATASGEQSHELHLYLIALGIRDCFAGRLYGPDLVRAHKAGPTYYERILADTGVSAASALMIDDNANAVSWAAQAGMQTVHMCRQGEPAPDADHVVGNLLELADLLNGA